MARTGMEILAEKLIKMIGLDPAIVLSKVDEIRGGVLNAAGDLAALRRDQIRIMEKLGISPETEVKPNGQSSASGGTSGSTAERKALN